MKAPKPTVRYLVVDEQWNHANAATWTRHLTKKDAESIVRYWDRYQPQDGPHFIIEATTTYRILEQE